MCSRLGPPAALDRGLTIMAERAKQPVKDAPEADSSGEEALIQVRRDKARRLREQGKNPFSNQLAEGRRMVDAARREIEPLEPAPPPLTRIVNVMP